MPRRNWLRRALRFGGAVLVVLVLASLMSAAGLYMLLRSDSLENSALNQRIESRIQQLVGRDFKVDLGRTTIAFDRDGLLAVAGNDVRILRAFDGLEISRIGRVAVGVKPMSLLSGDPQIDAVIISDTQVDVSLLPAGSFAWDARNLSQLLVEIGRKLAAAGTQFSGEKFRLFRFSDIELKNLPANAQRERRLGVENLELRFRRNAALQLEAQLESDFSKIEVAGRWRQVAEGGSALDFSVSGLDLRDVVRSPQEETGFAGSDAILALEGRVDFDSEGQPQKPQFSLSTINESTLRLGRYAQTPIHRMQLNFSVLTDRNQIELDPSNLVAGNFNARLIGGIRPVDEKQGYAGPLKFELIADPAAGAPTIVGEKSIVAAIRVGGSLLRQERRIDLDEILVLAGNDQATGSASFGFTGETPSIAAAAASNGMDVTAIKQLWPFFLAPPARNWVYQNVVGGRLSAIEISASVPAGIIGRFRVGKKIPDERLLVTADFSGVRLDTYGQLPAIREAAGKLSVNGMAFHAELKSGSAYLPDDNVARLTSGEFSIEDFGAPPVQARVRVSADGKAFALAQVAASNPIRAPQRANIDPATLSGEAKADVSVAFPIRKGLKPDEVEWSAVVETRNAAISVPYADRKIANADLVIGLTPKAARIEGTAEVDGVPTTLSLLEPLPGSDVKQERRFTAVLDEKARKKMGLELAPVIRGTIKVAVEQGGKNDGYQVMDLSAAQLALPWVGWTKGKGIPAKATFRLRTEKGISHLDDFYVEGPGFSAAGKLAFDKTGILTADFANVSLNEGDNLAVALTRKGTLYKVIAEGARYDARGLINKLIHEGGFGDTQGSTNAQVSATIGTVLGFNEGRARNVTINYGTREGWFDHLSLRGNVAREGIVNIVASTAERQTSFEIDSTDAGTALGMLDIYRRMKGGRIVARLKRDGAGPFTGPVRVTNFVVENEPKLEKLVTEPAQIQTDRGGTQQVQEKLKTLDVKRVRFNEGHAFIDKGEGYLNLGEGVLASSQIGFTFDGSLYDAKSRMDLSGTFMPGLSLSRALSFIPIVGELLGNGRDSSLIGITYRLRGPIKNPQLEVNPISVVAPGVFRKVFEFRD
ncbi:MAG: DUF3971 domain-containing protein [Rhizobiaceae bacterium]